MNCQNHPYNCQNDFLSNFFFNYSLYEGGVRLHVVRIAKLLVNGFFTAHQLRKLYHSVPFFLEGVNRDSMILFDTVKFCSEW